MGSQNLFDQYNNIGQIDNMGSKASRLGVAWAAGRLAGRRLLRRAESKRDEELGALLTGQLDELKGLAMKLGQIVSYMDVPLPASAQAQLAKLQTGVTGMPVAKTEAALADALGPSWRDRFDTFELEPIAAASIGQVHRATVGGVPIALKLRYPEVARSVEKDLAPLRRIASLASVATSVDGRAIVGELAARFAEECDYEREGRHQTFFRRAFEDDPDLSIPQVLESLSTTATLATTWAPGRPFAAACEMSPAIRDRYARALVRFTYRSLLTLGTIQADPHPGNFLFDPSGRVVCLDFGCVRRLGPALTQHLRTMILALEHEDRAAFREATLEIGLAPKPRRFDFDYHFEMMAHLHRPLLSPRFAFTPEFVQRGLAFNGPTNPNARHMAMPPAYVWIARLQWGLWSLLTRLHADVMLSDILESVLAEPLAPAAPADVHPDAPRTDG